MAHAVSRQGRRLNVAGMAMPGSRVARPYPTHPGGGIHDTTFTHAGSLHSGVLRDIVHHLCRRHPDAAPIRHCIFACHWRRSRGTPAFRLATPPAHVVQTRSATKGAACSPYGARPRPGSSTSVRGGPSQVTQPNFLRRLAARRLGVHGLRPEPAETDAWSVSSAAVPRELRERMHICSRARPVAQRIL